MKTFGITGSIASGKSAVQAILETWWPVIDADAVSREVVARGEPGLAMVVEAFGQDILLEDGSLDRAALRNIIAHSKEQQQRLNGILHPLIVGTILDRVRALAVEGHEVAFVSAALMLETGSYKNYDGVLLVSAPESLRLQRLLARDQMTESAARNLMARQMPDEEKRRFATVEIVNDGSLEALYQSTMTVLTELGITPPAERR